MTKNKSNSNNALQNVKTQTMELVDNVSEKIQSLTEQGFNVISDLPYTIKNRTSFDFSGLFDGMFREKSVKESAR